MHDETPQAIPRPPWRVPPGRAPSFWQSLRIALPAGLLAFVSNPWADEYPPDPMRIPQVCVAAIFVAYGLLIVATANRPMCAPDWIRNARSRTAAIVFGSAFIVPPVLGRGIQLLFGDTQPGLLYWMGGAAILLWGVLILAARVATDRAASQRILQGHTPTFQVTPDGFWWWDVDHWVRVGAAAPPNAFRAPDGNYWWTGTAWLPMPPRAFSGQQLRGERLTSS